MKPRVHGCQGSGSRVLTLNRRQATRLDAVYLQEDRKRRLTDPCRRPSGKVRVLPRTPRGQAALRSGRPCLSAAENTPVLTADTAVSPNCAATVEETLDLLVRQEHGQD